MKLIKINDNEHRIEGLTDIQVLRIYKALESANNSNYVLELDIMINCLRVVINKINALDKSKI